MAVLALVFGGAILVLLIIVISHARRTSQLTRRAHAGDGSGYSGDGGVWMFSGSHGGSGGSGDCGSSGDGGGGGCDGGGGGGGD